MRLTGRSERGQTFLQMRNVEPFINFAEVRKWYSMWEKQAPSLRTNPDTALSLSRALLPRWSWFDHDPFISSTQNGKSVHVNARHMIRYIICCWFLIEIHRKRFSYVELEWLEIHHKRFYKFEWLITYIRKYRYYKKKTVLIM